MGKIYETAGFGFTRVINRLSNTLWCDFFCQLCRSQLAELWRTVRPMSSDCFWWNRHRKCGVFLFDRRSCPRFKTRLGRWPIWYGNNSGNVQKSKQLINYRWGPLCEAYCVSFQRLCPWPQIEWVSAQTLKWMQAQDGTLARTTTISGANYGVRLNLMWYSLLRSTLVRP